MKQLIKNYCYNKFIFLRFIIEYKQSPPVDKYRF